MQDTADRSGISRRTVLAGAAWTVPAVVATSTLPAYAASRTDTQVSVLNAATGATGNISVITVGFHTTDGTAVKAGTQAVITVDITTVPNSKPTYGISTPVGCSLVSITPDTRTTAGTIVVVVQLSTNATGPDSTASFTVTEWKQGSVGTAQATGGSPATNNGSVTPTGSPVSIPTT